MAQDTSFVKENYSTSKNLTQRISLHEKYSTNKMGFKNWILSYYDFKNVESGVADEIKVLELGCGTGDMWIGQDELISKCSEIILSDFSEGMLETTKENLSQYDNIEFRMIDIQDIPYEDDSFDIVIAHSMLYHVPDIAKAVSEVRRVLKEGGKFYSATYGENGIMPYVCSLLDKYDIKQNMNLRFTCQNGAEQLEKSFENVEFVRYEDSLEVTDIDDLITYMYSLVSMQDIQNAPKDEVKKILEGYMVDGVLSIPKDYGMFISK